MNDEAFMVYLKIHHNYLYHIEMEKRRIIDKYGFGEISTNIKIQNNKPKFIEFLNMGMIKLDDTKFT